MNDKTNQISKQKRASLKRIRNVGVGTAAIASFGMTDWMRPVVQQVVLPAHADTTPLPPCGDIAISAVMGLCSSGVPVDMEISSPSGDTLRILSVPTLVTTPPSLAHAFGSWLDPLVTGAVPAEINATDVFVALAKGQVVDESICSTPATTVPNSGGQPLTRMDLTINYLCIQDGLEHTVTIDILPLL